MIALKSITRLVPTLCGLASIVVVSPLATSMGTMAQRVRKDVIAKTDARVQLVAEVFSSAPSLLCPEVPALPVVLKQKAQLVLSITRALC